MNIKKILYLTILLVVMIPTGVQAQAEEITPIEIEEQANVEPIAEPGAVTPRITSEDYIEFGKKTLFDATDSSFPNDDTASYRWDFTDSAAARFGQELLYEFSATGIHRVTLTIVQGDQTASVEKEVFVYDSQMLMIADKDIATNLNEIVEQAANNGVLLKILSAESEETGFLTEEKLIPLITGETDFVRSTDALIFYTSGATGLQAFTRYWQSLAADKKVDVQNKLLITITDQNMSIAADLTQQSFRVLNPRFILLTRKEAINPIFETKDDTELIDNLDSRAIEYRIVDARSEKSKAFFLSHAISTFIAKGIPINTIYLLLAAPFIVVIITFARQIVGIAAFGIYTPLVIALSFIILGVYIGLGTLILVVIVSYLLRLALGAFRLHYIPKTGIILSVTALSFLVVIWLLSIYRVSLAASLAIFPMLVMSTIAEKFLSAQSEEGIRGAFFGVLKTIIVAIAAYYLVVWDSFTNLVMSWPELIIAPLLVMIVLGRFTGLRLTEYARFRSLFKEKNIEE